MLVWWLVVTWIDVCLLVRLKHRGVLVLASLHCLSVLEVRSGPLQ